MAFEQNDSRALNQIRMYLNAAEGGEDTAAYLIREVRNALSGKNEPTVRQTILNLETTIKAEFAQLVQTIRPGGMPLKPDAARSEGDTKTLKDIYGKLVEAVVALEGGGGGGHGGGADAYGANVFQREVMLKGISSTTMLWQEIKTGSGILNSVFKTFTNLKTEGLNAAFEGVLNNLIRTGLGLVNLTTAFDKFTHTLKESVAGFRENIFGTNVLSPKEYFFEFFDRIQKGILTDTDAFRTTVKNINQTLESGLASPLAMTGKTAAQLSNDLNLARQGIARQGPDPRAFGTTGQTERWMTDMMDSFKKFGMNAALNDPITQKAMGNQISLLGKIAGNTGASVDNLQKMVKKYEDENAILAGIGQLTGQELKNMGTVQTDLKSTIGQESASAIDQMAKKFLAGGRPGAFSPVEDPDLWGRIQQIPGALETWEKMTQAYIAGNAEETKKQVIALGQLTGQFAQMGHDSPWLQKQLIGAQGVSMLSSARIAMNQLTGITPPTPEQLARQQGDPTVAAIEHAFSIFENNIRPLFMGLDGAIGANVIALLANTAVIGAMVGRMNMFGPISAALAKALDVGGVGGAVGGGGGGAVASLGRMASTIGRFVGPVAGGVVGAGSAYLEGAGTGGIVGAGVGGAGGVAIGAALGSFAGPVGTVIGSVVGGYLGPMFGRYLGEMVSPTAAAAGSPAAAAPAVQPPGANMVGPEMSAVAAQQQDMGRTYHGEQMQYLSGLLNAGVDGNNILGQIYSQLVSQTAAVTGQSGAASAPLPAHGLASAAPSLSSPMRAQAAYPYASVDY